MPEEPLERELSTLVRALAPVFGMPAFAPHATVQGDLDLVDFIVPAGGGTASATPLTLRGDTVAGGVILAVVSRTDVASAVISATLEIQDVAQLTRIMTKIERLPNIKDVFRKVS